MQETVERTARENNVKWSLRAQKGKRRINKEKCGEITQGTVILLPDLEDVMAGRFSGDSRKPSVWATRAARISPASLSPLTGSWPGCIEQ